MGNEHDSGRAYGHLIRPEIRDEDSIHAEVAKQLHDRFGDEHATIQIERGNDLTGQPVPDDVALGWKNQSQSRSSVAMEYAGPRMIQVMPVAIVASKVQAA